MKKLVLEIPGEAIAKQRPRATVIGGHAKVYTPKETINYESYIKYLFTSKFREFVPLEVAIKIDIEIHKTIPISVSDKKKKLMKDNLLPATTKPDLDNIIKIITDALNKVAYKDDNLIVEINARKKYSKVPKAIVTIEECLPNSN